MKNIELHSQNALNSPFTWNFSHLDWNDIKTEKVRTLLNLLTLDFHFQDAKVFRLQASLTLRPHPLPGVKSTFKVNPLVLTAPPSSPGLFEAAQMAAHILNF